MANFVNPYEFIQPLMVSPVPAMNAGLTAGEKLAQLGPTIANQQAMTDLHREQAIKARAANEAYNNLLQGGGISTDEPISTDKAFQMYLAGINPEPIMKVQDRNRAIGAQQKFGDWYKQRTAPTITEQAIPQAGIGEESIMKVETPAKPVTAEEILKARLAIPEFQAEAAKDLTTLATLERAAKTAENQANRDYYTKLWHDQMILIQQKNADTNARRAEAMIARVGAGSQGKWQFFGTDADGSPMFFNPNNPQQIVKGGEQVYGKPKIGSKPENTDIDNEETGGIFGYLGKLLNPPPGPQTRPTVPRKPLSAFGS